MKTEAIDEKTRVIAIEVLPSSIVFVQALFESYDGLAVVKTLDERRGVISIITTPEQVQTCGEVLESMQTEIPWRMAENPGDLEQLFRY